MSDRRNWLVSLAAVSLTLLSGCQSGPSKAFPTGEALAHAGSGRATEISTWSEVEGSMQHVALSVTSPDPLPVGRWSNGDMPLA
jgi:hypothetical protein